MWSSWNKPQINFHLWCQNILEHFRILRVSIWNCIYFSERSHWKWKSQCIHVYGRNAMLFLLRKLCIVLPNITQQLYLRNILNYSPFKGKFIWNVEKGKEGKISKNPMKKCKSFKGRSCEVVNCMLLTSIIVQTRLNQCNFFLPSHVHAFVPRSVFLVVPIFLMNLPSWWLL